MKKIADNILRDIAEELLVLPDECHLYLNKKTLVSSSFPIEALSFYEEMDDDDDWDDWDDLKDWKEEVEYLHEHYEDFVRIQPMNTRASFAIMEDFTNEKVTNPTEQSILFKALGQSKPFRRFKDIVENSSYREIWFDFRQKRYEDYVLEILEDEIA
jgi:hypothetical protein